MFKYNFSIQCNSSVNLYFTRASWPTSMLTSSTNVSTHANSKSTTHTTSHITTCSPSSSTTVSTYSSSPSASLHISTHESRGSRLRHHCVPQLGHIVRRHTWGWSWMRSWRWPAWWSIRWWAAILRVTLGAAFLSVAVKAGRTGGTRLRGSSKDLELFLEIV